MLCLTFSLFLAGFYFTGCQKIEGPTDDTLKTTDVVITPKGDKVAVIDDTTRTEQSAPVSLKAEGPVGVTITTWNWSITEPNGQVTNMTGQNVLYTFTSLGLGQITATGTDNSGTLHTGNLWIQVMVDITEAQLVRLYSSTPIGGGVIQTQWAAVKKLWKFSGTYGVIGSPTNWIASPLTPADTNWRIINGSLITVAAPENGKFIVPIVNINPAEYPTSYEMGIYKTNPSGNQIWGNFTGSPWVDPSNPSLIKFTVINASGTIVPTSNPGNSGPGEIGDNYIQVSITSTKVTVYINNGTAFSGISPFYMIQNADGTWNNPTTQTAIPGFANWGKFEMTPAQIEVLGGVISFRYGNTISQPSIYNANMHSSGYYDGFNNSVRIIAEIITVNSNGGLEKRFLVHSTRMIRQEQ